MLSKIKKALKAGKLVVIRTDNQETHIVVDVRDNVLVTDQGYVHISHVMEVS